MQHKRVMLLSVIIIAVIGFAFFVPIVHTTYPPPTYHTSCSIPCAPYIAQGVYGSVTYYYLGSGAEFVSHWGDFSYYRLYVS